VIEVHPPSEPVHGWRDFLLHLLTITIGLLIALSLEGLVEWRHHLQLVREAEESLQIEIKANAGNLQGVLDDLGHEQELLAQDVAVMKKIIANPKVQNRDDLTINFRVRTFDDVSWKTAQSSGALSYMPYTQALAYSKIYSAQNEIGAAEHQAVRDTVVSVAPFLNTKKGDVNPSGDEAVKIKDHLERLQGQLFFLEDLVKGLDAEYKKFFAAHRE
jgi:hypothetical protein